MNANEAAKIVVAIERIKADFELTDKGAIKAISRIAAGLTPLDEWEAASKRMKDQLERVAERTSRTLWQSRFHAMTVSLKYRKQDGDRTRRSRRGLHEPFTTDTWEKCLARLANRAQTTTSRLNRDQWKRWSEQKANCLNKRIGGRYAKRING